MCGQSIGCTTVSLPSNPSPRRGEERTLAKSQGNMQTVYGRLDVWSCTFSPGELHVQRHGAKRSLSIEDNKRGRLLLQIETWASFGRMFIRHARYCTHYTHEYFVAKTKRVHRCQGVELVIEINVHDPNSASTRITCSLSGTALSPASVPVSVSTGVTCASSTTFIRGTARPNPQIM